MAPKRFRRPAAKTSWDALAGWYAGWTGDEGGEYHRQLAIPALLDLLAPAPGEQILDIGAGAGVLAPYIARAGACYTGVDASPKLLAHARRSHGAHGRFLVADAARLAAYRELRAGAFDGAAFLLSIQDMDPLDAVLRSAAWALRMGGRLALVMTHPCFRVPRQSGWGWDAGRKLHYRRVDRYLTPLAVPMKAYGGARPGVTRSFHRPLEAYVNGLAACGLLVECVREIPAAGTLPRGRPTRPDALADAEIPLFLALRARKGGA